MADDVEPDYMHAYRMEQLRFAMTAHDRLSVQAHFLRRSRTPIYGSLRRRRGDPKLKPAPLPPSIKDPQRDNRGQFLTQWRRMSARRRDDASPENRIILTDD